MRCRCCATCFCHWIIQPSFSFPFIVYCKENKTTIWMKQDSTENPYSLCCNVWSEQWCMCIYIYIYCTYVFVFAGMCVSRLSNISMMRWHGPHISNESFCLCKTLISPAGRASVCVCVFSSCYGRLIWLESLSYSCVYSDGYCGAHYCRTGMFRGIMIISLSF